MTDFFPPKQEPCIYAYSDTRFPNLLKIGYTTRTAAQRIAEQFPVTLPEASHKIVFDRPALRDDGSLFDDHAIHRQLKKDGIRRDEGEWFHCRLEQLQAAFLAVKTGKLSTEHRSQDFRPRPEQQQAIAKTVDYFNSFADGETNGDYIPHFLWNAKMRFGKTFTAYQLAKQMDWKKVLVLTFKPAVQSAWKDDLQSHIDFQGWQFVSNKAEDLSYDDLDRAHPFVCFGSFQDFLGKNKAGGIKPKNEWVHAIHWDCVIFDEYHYGAWRDTAKDLFDEEDKKEQRFAEGEGLDYFDEELMPITTNHYLYLSGTPFRAIESGEFIEEQIFNWTYSDEQRAKTMWAEEHGKLENPYASLPRMVMMTYQLPDSVREIAALGEFDEFDLNQFFAAEGENDNATFKHENEVQKWLDLIRGSHRETAIDNLKMGAKKPPLPFSDTRLLNVLQHTFWFLPSVAACFAMRNLLAQRQNVFYHDYTVIVSAGAKAGIGLDALPPVTEAMANPLESKTITLSCGKLTTGVSVKPWTGIFMLRNVQSPETYFQAAFRVQTPWTLKNPDKQSPNKELIIKNECYVFDFSPNRALKQIADYSGRLNVDDNSSPENKVAEFIQFLPVLAYDGSSMKAIDAAGILDIAMSGTSATLLARRWESALLVNVDNVTLQRLMDSDQAMSALKKIEGFRQLNQDIETIINKSESVKKAKKEAGDEGLSPKEKKALTADEKEYKSKRKMIQEKLIKFATRIPVFMYLSDYREHTLKDVITQLEPALFRKVTGLEVRDFELLVSLNVFNDGLMNDAVYKFKRYEDASLSYTGINKNDNEEIGLYSTTIGEDKQAVFENRL